MARYIDADQKVNAQYYDEMYEEWLWKETTVDDVLATVLDSEVPAADVVERKKGKWIKMSDADGVYWACSECGEDIPRVSHYDPQFDLFPRLESIEKTNFCPNCGAEMERSEDIDVY